MTRRSFVQTSAATAALPAAGRLPIKKAVLLSMIQAGATPREKFEIAREAGFDAMEVGNAPDMKSAEEIARASQEAKLPIHGVMNMEHWKSPLSSDDPAVARRTIESMRLSIEQAKLWGASTVLLVPAVVNPATRYEDAWTRSQARIRELLPAAEKARVVIAVENVWNKFLLSPLEMRRYVDDFRSPWLRSYLDVGNMLLFGYPQDWIATLGKDRIAKLHLKDFRFVKRQAEFVNLREGEVDWKAVHAALAAIGWSGYATVELTGGDAAYLKDVARRVDLILEGADSNA
jgi:L-ribulose-5-phosphate 3-epimerase